MSAAERSLIKFMNSLLGREKLRLDRRVGQFAIFLAVSASLWFLLKLSHEYTTDIQYPIELVSPPAGKMLIGEPTRSVRLKVKAHGYTLLKYKASALKSPVKLPIGDYYSEGAGNSGFYMLTRGFRQNFVSQVRGDLDLQGIVTDTIFFQMAGVIEKEVDVTPRVNITFAKQHMLSGEIEASPSRIRIIGPKAILDTISRVNTKPISTEILSATKTYQVDLQQISQVIFSVSSVSLTIPVERFTETSLEVPVKLTNVPDSIKLVVLPSKITVKCNVPMAQYFTLKPTSFELSCNFHERDSVANGKIKLHLSETPSFVSRVTFSPEYIDYFTHE